jgi:hypothetical protein
MGKWTFESFGNAFLNNTLGRKSSHGSMYVVETDTAHFLMKKSHHGWSEQVVAIKFGDGINIINTKENTSQYRGNGYNIGGHNFPYKVRGFPRQVGDIANSGLIESRSIHVGMKERKEFLCQVGSKRLLFLASQHGTTVDDIRNKKDYNEFAEFDRYWFDESVSSLAEAKEKIIPDRVREFPDSIRVIRKWFIPTPDLKLPEVPPYPNPDGIPYGLLVDEIDARKYRSSNFQWLDIEMRRKIMDYRSACKKYNKFRNQHHIGTFSVRYDLSLQSGLGTVLDYRSVDDRHFIKGVYVHDNPSIGVVAHLKDWP